MISDFTVAPQRPRRAMFLIGVQCAATECWANFTWVCKVTSCATRSTIYMQGALSRSHVVIDYLCVKIVIFDIHCKVTEQIYPCTMLMSWTTLVVRRLARSAMGGAAELPSSESFFHGI